MISVQQFCQERISVPMKIGTAVQNAAGGQPDEIEIDKRYQFEEISIVPKKLASKPIGISCRNP